MKINFTETVLRDGNQSLIATRMPMSDIEPILDVMDKAGYYSIECWGGATFDSCLRYLDEDPWERLRIFRKHFKNTKLQMLLRGQNLLGYKHYPDDVVRAFVRKSVENGIDIIRIFDALNDLRNIEVAVDEAIKAGAHVQGTLCYTTSPIHNIDMFVQLSRDLEKMGVHSICIKDMAGIMTPKNAYDLTKAIKEAVSLPVVVHTHSTTGVGAMTLLKAVEAGAAGIVVSNHGGRVLGQTRATADVLPDIARAVKGKCVILVDGGIRSGVDVFKAIALGADAVLIGRPFVPAVYGGEAEGAKLLFDKYKAELIDTMTMCGAHSLAEISPDMVYVEK